MHKKRWPSKRKKVKPTFFVFCEGKTEELYVKFLRAKYRVPIEIDAQITGSRIDARYIKRYKKDKSTHENDKDFLLYDLDVPELFARLGKIKNAVLLLTNPCIEFWFLLHLKEEKARIDCGECIREIEKKLGKYSKTNFDGKFRDLLNTKLEKAGNRARRLEHFANPSSTVYRLIEELEKVKKESM